MEMGGESFSSAATDAALAHLCMRDDPERASSWGRQKAPAQGRWVGRDGGNAVVSARHVARTSRARTPRRRTSARREGRVWILVVVKVGVR